MRFTDAEYSILKQNVKDWIVRIDEEEELPKGIKALNFGLFEPYGIELTGAKVYNAEDDDWSLREDFVPEERECPDLEIDEHIEWEYFRKVMVRILKEAMSELKEIDLLRVPHITTGFREGDLVLIR
ncbi:MAG: hypothetical protein RR202_02450 [Bacteroidales bacterium]